MLLLIDTSGDTASIIVCQDGTVKAFAENSVARDHSAWLHPAISRLLQETGSSLRKIQAVAVMSGPGSYTGLRVGMAAAKGFCFALKIPLISCNNLLLMAMSMVPLSADKNALLCPMIDARRLEVFAAIYSNDLEVVRRASPVILDKSSFEAELTAGTILFSGSGAAKWQEICTSTNARFISQPPVRETFVKMATDYFLQSKWADTVYAEPEYGKEFHTHVEN